MKLSFICTKNLIAHLSLALMLIFHFGVWKMNVCSWRQFLSGQKKLDVSILDSPSWPFACQLPVLSALSSWIADTTMCCLPHHGKLQSAAVGQAQSKAGPDDMNFSLAQMNTTESYVCLLRSGAEGPSQRSRTGSLIGYSLTVLWAGGSQRGGVGSQVIITYPVFLSVERKG